MKHKTKGLLVWFEMDKRPELLAPFASMDNEIEFTQLYYRTKEDRKINISPFPMIYWFDYTSPYQIIKKIKPDFIIGVTEGLMEISLINAAKEYGIPYYGLQHGFTPENISSLLPEINRPSVFSLETIKKYLKIFRFYFFSLRVKNVNRLFEKINFLFSFYKMNPLDAISKKKYNWLKPNAYICFSEQSAFHYRHLYGLSPKEIKYIGISGFDDFFKGVKEGSFMPKEEKYFVLIDTNFEEYHTPISKEKIWRCYNELKAYCLQKKARLYIKLHPWSYKYEYDDSEAINFIKDINMNALGKFIASAEACFGFYSTLTIPIAFIKPTIQIKYDDVVEQGLVNEGITPVLDFFTFFKEDINFSEPVSNKNILQEKYLFSTDGNSAERIKNILLNGAK